jgi:hypothetical protein
MLNSVTRLSPPSVNIKSPFSADIKNISAGVDEGVGVGVGVTDEGVIDGVIDCVGVIDGVIDCVGVGVGVGSKPASIIKFNKVSVNNSSPFSAKIKNVSGGVDEGVGVSVGEGVSVGVGVNVGTGVSPPPTGPAKNEATQVRSL